MPVSPEVLGKGRVGAGMQPGTELGSDLWDPTTTQDDEPGKDKVKR